MTIRVHAVRSTSVLLLLAFAALLGPRIVLGDRFAYDSTLLSGHWYDPTHSGEGVNLDMISPKRGILYWFTYDDAGNQFWLGGVGAFENDTLVVEDMVTTRGGVFGPAFDPDSVSLISWGRVSLTFESCHSARLEYAGPPAFGTGQLDMQRLARNEARPCPPSRQFRLGFTPFPHDATADALDFSYDVLQQDADIVSHHFDNGVPWPQALAGGGPSSYHPAHYAEWQERRERTPDDHAVFVSITPIDISRSELAPYRGEHGDIPRTELGDGWGSEFFDSERVRLAFLNYAVDAVEFFDPDYLAIGIEVNLLLDNTPEAWESYLALHRSTWINLKSRYPDLPVFVSVTGHHLLGSLSDPSLAHHERAFRDVIGFSDLFGISLYPFMDLGLEIALPIEDFQDLFALSDKPMAITETAAPAESVVLADEPGQHISRMSSPAVQNRYFENLFRTIGEEPVRFVINFVPRDYDALCESLGGCSVLDALWRDTGFYDETGQSRPILQTWRKQLERPIER